MSLAFDEGCRRIMDKLFVFGKEALDNRKANASHSYEYRLFHFLASDDYFQLCKKVLPTEAMQTIEPGCTILGHCLGEIFRTWLIDAVRNERRRKDPELFRKAQSVNLSDEVIKSETNRILGWAVKSARDQTKNKTSDEYKLLSSMVCYEKDIDGKDLMERCDLTTLLQNKGGEGGLCLVSEAFFAWGNKLIRTVAKQFTQYDIDSNGDDALRFAKRAILNQPTLKSDFALACKRQETRSLVQGELDPSLPKFSYQLSSKIYEIVVDKVCNTRFGEVMKNYVERMTAKGKLNFRSSLLALTSGISASTGKDDSALDTKESLTDAAMAAPHTPQTKFVPLSLGVDGAATEKVLRGMTFVLAGIFDEVEGQKSEVHNAISKMVASFGGKVNARFSKNTTHLLAGKDAPGDKFKEASKRKLTVISLRRLEQLLLGRMAGDELAKLDTLTRDSFKGDNYQPAGVVVDCSPHHSALA